MSTSPENPPIEPHRRRLLAASVLVTIGCAVLLLLTSPGLPMAWDEGNAIRRAEGIARWARRWVGRGEDGRQLGPLSAEAIGEDWRYTARIEGYPDAQIDGRPGRIEGHPAFYGIVIAAGRWLSAGWLEPLTAARFGPMLLFGLAAGAMFYRMGRDDSAAAALGAVAALVLLPRMFAHAHFASFDGPLTACWVLAWAGFAAARANWRGAVLWGILLGMTLSCKATGWIAPLPFLAWAVVYRDRPAAKALAVGIPVALVAFFLLNPRLWHHPIEGSMGFFALNTSRAEFNISTQFLGQMYNLDHPLPWYNTLFWTGVTVPLPLLLLTVVGLVAILRRWRAEKAGILLLANGLVLLIVRALPMAPPHDGVRLFLPSFAFLAALAGVGCGWLLSGRRKRVHTRVALASRQCTGKTPVPARYHRATLALAGIVTLYAASASSLLWYAPQWLSYYNLAIGGLPGAARWGMEPTYYWDGLDRPTLDWLAGHTAPGEKVRFAAAPAENLELMRRWGTLGSEYRPDAPGRFRWYVVQHRPSGWQPPDRWLMAHPELAAYRKTIRRGGWGPWQLDVPLVAVYPYEAYLRGCEATGIRNGD